VPVVDRYCTACGFLVPGTSRFCPNCGAPLPGHPSPPSWGHHFPLRFQVEPGDPPYRDVRWLQIVIGTALAVVGGFLLVVWGIVSDVASSSAVFELIFLVPGVILLGAGILLCVVGFYRTLSTAAR
jgi:hypothetical protein